MRFYVENDQIVMVHDDGDETVIAVVFPRDERSNAEFLCQLANDRLNDPCV